MERSPPPNSLRAIEKADYGFNILCIMLIIFSKSIGMNFSPFSTCMTTITVMLPKTVMKSNMFQVSLK